jgi:uncharacterized protein
MASDVTSLLPMMLMLIATGLLAGTLAGLLGVGGGIVMVPVLYHVFGSLDVIQPDVVMHMAVGTSLATMIPTSIRSAFGHRRKGNVDDGLLKIWLLPVVIGAGAGVMLGGFAKGPVLMGIFRALPFSSRYIWDLAKTAGDLRHGCRDRSASPSWHVVLRSSR